MSKTIKTDEASKVITSKQKNFNPKPSISIENGVIGSKLPKESKSEKTIPVSSAKKVALFSTKNVSWPGVGKVFKGYNIVSESVSEKWLTRSHIRLAEPEEVAREFEK